MGSYKWCYMSPNMACKYSHIVTLLISPFITTHEPPSRDLGFRLQGLGFSV